MVGIFWLMGFMGLSGLRPGSRGQLPGSRECTPHVWNWVPLETLLLLMIVAWQFLFYANLGLTADVVAWQLNANNGCDVEKQMWLKIRIGFCVTLHIVIKDLLDDNAWWTVNMEYLTLNWCLRLMFEVSWMVILCISLGLDRVKVQSSCLISLRNL